MSKVQIVLSPLTMWSKQKSGKGYFWFWNKVFLTLLGLLDDGPVNWYPRERREVRATSASS